MAAKDRAGGSRLEPELRSRSPRRVAIRHLPDRGLRAFEPRPGPRERRVELREDDAVVAARDEDILAVHEGLLALAELSPRLVRVVELRYFAGASVEETAVALEVSTPTVKRDWQKARAFLHRQLG